MPILGLTDRPAAFPQIGELRKGAPKPEKGPGRDLQHFRFTTTDPEAQALFDAAYGTEPASVEVYLPYATTGENFAAWKEDWVSSSLVHRCDGQTTVLLRTQQGSYTTAPHRCPGGCKQVGRLMVILPVLRRFAYVTVLTTSIHDIMELNENLLALETMRGDLRGIPLIVSRKPRKISMPGQDGKRKRVEKWLLSIEAKPAWVDLQLTSMEKAALQLPSGTSSTQRLITVDQTPQIVDVITGELFDDDAEIDAQLAQEQVDELYAEPKPVARNTPPPRATALPIRDTPATPAADFTRALQRIAFDLGIETPADELKWDKPSECEAAGKAARERIFAYIKAAGLSTDGLTNTKLIKERAMQAKVVSAPVSAAA